MRKLLLTIPILALAACGDATSPKASGAAAAKPASAAQKIEMNLSSPDQAIKTWWKVRDLAEFESFERCEKYRSEPDDEALSTKYAKSVTTGMALAQQTPPLIPCTVDLYSREIMEVKVESETRAVVLVKIKPATPIPAGAVLTSQQEKSREEGGRYKYVLERVGAEWKIEQIYQFWDFLDDPWRPIYEEQPTTRPHVHLFGPQ